MSALVVSREVFESWEKMLTLTAELMQVPVCLVSSACKTSCTVRAMNDSSANPFEMNERRPYHKNDLCHRVVEHKDTLCMNLVEDVYSEHGMKSYLGKPLLWPDGTVYGTFVLMDTMERNFGPELLAIFEQTHVNLECQLALVYEQYHHNNTQRSLAQYQQQYKELISKDSLTGVYNRRTLQDLAVAELSRTTRKAGCFALVLLDIDHFKQINDEYGHMAGDAVLKHLACSAQEMLRQSDFVARITAEEFCLLMPEMDPEKAVEILDRLRKRLASSPAEYNGNAIYYTVSMGCSLFESGMITTVEELLSMAEMALKEAKESGRNRVCLATQESYEQALYSAL